MPFFVFLPYVDFSNAKFRLKRQNESKPIFESKKGLKFFKIKPKS